MYNSLFTKTVSFFLLVFLSVTVVAQPVFVSTTGAGAQGQYISPSFEGYSPEDVVLAYVGREVFSRASTAELMRFCSDPDGPEKITDEVEKLLDAAEFDYTGVCKSLDNGLREAEMCGDWCDDARRQGGISCPPDEEKLFQQCTDRLANEKKFSDVEEDDLFWCEREFAQHKGEIARYCRGDLILGGRCPKVPVGSEWENECKRSGGTPRTETSPGGCSYPRCDFPDGVRPPIIIDPGVCQSVPIGWEEMCRRTGGFPSTETRGVCPVPRCDFGGDKPIGPVICPTIALPPNWQAECRARGGVPIPDDPYGCPRAECRMSNFCPPLPYAPAGSLCPFGETESIGVDAAGCKYLFCRRGNEPGPITTPCPEISSSWYGECRRSGGQPQVTSDPFRPACMQFSCSGVTTQQACPTATANDATSRDCASRSGTVYMEYGAGNCPIVRCNVAQPTTCPVDTFNEQGCREARGIVSTSYQAGCPYRYCSYNASTCPAAPTCSVGQAPLLTSYSGTCPTYQCQPTSCPAPPACAGGAQTPSGTDSQGCMILTCTGGGGGGGSCPTMPTCPAGQYAYSSPSAGGSGAMYSCPTYECIPSTCSCPAYTAPGSLSCSPDQTATWTEYSQTCANGQTIKCSTNTCQTLPLCAGGCGAPSSGCSAGMVPKITKSWSNYNGQACYCANTFCEPDYSAIPLCTSSTSCSAPSCTTGQVIKESDSFTTYYEGSQQCKCKSKWCENTATSCATATCPGASTTPTCGSGQIQRTSTTPYSPPGCSTSIQCTTTWCETDYSSLPTCSASTCPSSTCSSGQIRRTGSGYTTYSENGQQCKCESAWCETDPATCASATCPVSPACPGGATAQATGAPYQYSPPGCTSTSLQCQTYSCPTTSTNVSGSRATGLQIAIGAVPPSPAGTVASPRLPVPPEFAGPCVNGEVSKSNFLRECLSYRRAYSYTSFTPLEVERTCGEEARRNVYEMQNFCARVGSLDPYIECKDRAKKTREVSTEAYSQCKKLANKENVLELVKRKAENECRLREFSIAFLANATGELSPAEEAHADLVKGNIVLTQDELDKLKAEIRRDVLAQVSADLAKLFGARAEEEQAEAQRKTELADKLNESAAKMREICARVEDNECLVAVELERQAAGLRTEAQAQLNTAGGILGIISNIFSGK